MEIRKSYHLAHPVGAVYAAWVSSDTVIAPATRMEITPVVGGPYRLFIEDGSAVISQTDGSFYIVRPNARLRYSWEWNGDGETTQIDVQFEQTSGGTAITLIHSGFTKQASLDAHASGWDSYIEGFKRKLAAAES